MKWQLFGIFKSKGSVQEERNSSSGVIPFEQLDFNSLPPQSPLPNGVTPPRRGRVSPLQPRPQMIDYEVAVPGWSRSSLTMAVTRSSGFFTRFHHNRGPLYLSPADSANSYEDMLALDENNVKRGVNAKVISKLVVAAGRSDTCNECFICMEPIRSGCKVAKLPCQHGFCEACIRPWLADHRTCPVCRWEFADADTHLVK